jgi:hypothetical protein
VAGCARGARGGGGFTFLQASFSDCSCYTFEPEAYDVVGDAPSGPTDRSSEQVRTNNRAFAARMAT